MEVLLNPGSGSLLKTEFHAHSFYKILFEMIVLKYIPFSEISHTPSGTGKPHTNTMHTHHHTPANSAASTLFLQLPQLHQLPQTTIPLTHSVWHRQATHQHHAHTPPHTCKFRSLHPFSTTPPTPPTPPDHNPAHTPRLAQASHTPTPCTHTNTHL